MNAASLQKTESPALCFRSAQDAIDYAHHLTEDSNRRFALLNLSAIDRYIQGDVWLVVRVRADWCAGECEFVFYRVPIGVADSHSGSEAALCPIVTGAPSVAVSDDCRGSGQMRERKDRVSYIERDQCAVFLGVAELVQGPEGVIPSLVWLKRAEECEDFRRQILAASPSNHMLQGGSIVPEGKLGLLGIDFPASDRACVTALVEDGAEIVGSVKDDAGEVRWQPPCKLDLMKILSGWKVLVNDVGPWLCIDKLVDSSVEVVDVMLCARDR